MWKKLSVLVASLPLLGLAGCANPLHYSWAYTQLYNANSPAIQKSSGKPIYREFKTVQELADAEAGMYEQGYVMIGYVNMLSPQFDMIAKGGATKWGQEVGASTVLQNYGGGQFIATYWARPSSLPLGVFFSDKLPVEAQNLISSKLRSKGGVIAEIVAAGSLAESAGIAPGDLIVFANGQQIESSDQLNALIRESRGTSLTLTVWPMFDGQPVDITFPMERL